jgi:tetratricopeptide (TPR) repeat protein
MHKSIFLIFLPLYLISASINMNIMRDNNQTYSVVHLEDSNDIRCEVKMNAAFKDVLICHFQRRALKYKQPLENRYFKISFQENRIQIVPKYHFHYYPFKKSFIKDNVVDSYKSAPYKHWIIVGYKDKSSIFTTKNHEGLAFPITFQKLSPPMIGELNFDLHPVEKNIDANAIIKIKRAYNKKKYEKVLKEANYLLEEKKSVFSNEAKLYKIRALDKIIHSTDAISQEDGLDPNEIIDLALEWIAENPSNDHLAEMYMYIAKTYIKLGRSSKAKKYLEILEREYKDSKFNYLAKLANADKIYKVKSKDEGIKLYKEILYNTDDFDIASMAALKLANAYIDKENIKKAKLFLEKVISANKAFIKSHAKESYAIAKTFAENNESNLSIQIASLLKEDIDKTDIDAGELKKNIAYWYEKMHNYDKAVALYKKYLEEEKYGKYRDFVSERLDKVMLNSAEENITKKLSYLDNIMIKYKGDAIYAKALLAKANLYLKNRNYEAILSMEKELKKYHGDALLKEVAKKQLAIYYHDRACRKAVALEEEYNLTIEPSEEEAAFHCYVKLSKYKEALAISKAKIKSDALPQRLKWTYNSAKIYKKMGKYKALILAADDVEKLQKLLKSSAYNDIIYDKIEGYYYLGGYDELMLAEVKKVEKLFPQHVKNLDVYEKVLSYAKKRKDSSLIINYAKKMIDLQEKYRLETYTPKVQLDYINALRDKGRYKQALDEVLKLLYKKLNDTQRAHVLYLAGDLSEKFKKIKEAKEFYTKCGEIVENSAWVELCSENLQLLEE